MIELQHLSYSSISTYTNCARSWRYKYVEKIASPPSLSLVFGSAVHAVIEAAIRTPEPDTVAAFSRHWERESEALDMMDANKGLQDGLAVFKSPAVASLIAGLKPKRDSDGVPAIECKISLRVPGVPVPVIGFIDIIHEDGVPGDFKTAARMWPEDKPANEVQPLFYLAALSQAGELTAMRFRHHVVVKNSRVDVRTFETEYRPASLLWLFEAISDVWHGIQSGCFPPSPGSWLCSSKFCDYWSRCRGK